MAILSSGFQILYHTSFNTGTKNKFLMFLEPAESCNLEVDSFHLGLFLSDPLKHGYFLEDDIKSGCVSTRTYQG